jgi:lysophospholipase L1-like esterase
MRIAFVGDSLTEGRPGSSYFAMLRERLPEHTLVNLGRGNDTTVSLYRRLARQRFDEPFDLAFLWVGVNDVRGASPRSFELINVLLSKPRSQSHDEFRAYYQATLELLCRNAHRVIAVPPLLKGEDVTNPWNRELEVLARVIEELTSHYERAEYLDLRRVFVQRLAGRRIKSYLPRSVIRVALDALTLRSDEQIDRQAAERGLHVTLDGIHLNSVGARMVAEMFLEAIAKLKDCGP